VRFSGIDFTAPERINVGTDPSGVPFWALSAPADGSLDFVGKGAHGFAPRDTFRRAGLLRINAKPPRSDVFYLHSDGHQKDTALAGISLDFVDRPGVLGLSYLRLSDSDAPIRRGVNVVRVCGKATLPLTPVHDLFMAFEYVYEFKGDSPATRSGAGYAETGLAWRQPSWRPALHYRYTHSAATVRRPAAMKPSTPCFTPTISIRCGVPGSRATSPACIS